MTTGRCKKTVVVRGTVVHAYWDAVTGTMRVAVVTANDEAFEAAPDERGRELAQHIGRRVEATGRPGPDRDGVDLLSVESFRRLDEPDQAGAQPDWELDDDGNLDEGLFVSLARESNGAG